MISQLKDFTPGRRNRVSREDFSLTHLPRSSTLKAGWLLVLPLLSSLVLAVSAAEARAPHVLSRVRFKNWGISSAQGSPVNASIQATDAWSVTEGSRDIVVAVIDTGVDFTHPDIKANQWVAPQQKNTQGEAIYGWNFIDQTANPKDDHGHGTHVAGIIGAVANPKEGTSGVAQKVSIMAVKYYSPENSGAVNLRNTVKAIDYAVQNGARIINYSGGGPEFSEEEYLAIKKAEAKGVLFVAAAGNERQDTDQVDHYYYPAAYRLSNIVSVAATTVNNELLRSSNWGKRRVDVAAPGENIYSTLPDGKYGFMSGTSQATAFVSGLAALLLAKNPKLTVPELKALILSQVDPLPNLKLKVASGGKVNAYHSLLALEKGIMPTSTPSERLVGSTSDSAVTRETAAARAKSEILSLLSKVKSE